MVALIHGMNSVGNEPRAVLLAFSISMVCHLVFFAGLVFLPSFEPKRPFIPPVIDVSIVSLPQAQKIASEAKPVVAEKIDRPAAEEKVADLANDAVKIPTEQSRGFKDKISLKEKTFKAPEVVKRAISKIEERIESSRAQPVREAIDDLKKTVQTVEDTKNAFTSDRSYDDTGKGNDRALELMDIYKAEIPYRIQKNWAFSEQLAGGRTDLAAWLVIEIQKNGRIRDIWFEKRSGNRYFDEQAYKAVKKSDPLPPLPEGYSRPYFNIGLRFTPSGLK